jgi:hypothetical protein
MIGFLKKAGALAVCAAPSFGYIVPTPTSNANVPNLLEQRAVEHFCQDSCAQWLDGDSRLAKEYFAQQCSTFLSTAIGPTVVTYGRLFHPILVH